MVDVIAQWWPLGVTIIGWLVAGVTAYTNLKLQVQAQTELNHERFGEVVKRLDKLDSKFDDVIDFLLRQNGSCKG